MSPQLPGVLPERNVNYRQVLLADPVYLPGGMVLDGSKSRDAASTQRTAIQAGTPLGKLSSNGQYAPSILGKTTLAYDKDAVDGSELKLSVGAAVATEVLHRLGGVGAGKTIRVVGPETAEATVNEVVIQIDAVDTVTGELTLNAVLTHDMIAGALILADDGAQALRLLMPDGPDVLVVDQEGIDISVSVATPLMGGFLNVSGLKWYPADEALKQWYKSALNLYGQFQFSDDY